jgi:hypothetical protein
VSWDVDAVMDTGGQQPATIAEAGNYTYNVSKMYYHVLPDGLRGLDGRLCGDALPLIQDACKRLRDDPGKYKAMNPPNGWGDYDGALQFLVGIGDMCECHPKATLRIT